MDEERTPVTDDEIETTPLAENGEADTGDADTDDTDVDTDDTDADARYRRPVVTNTRRHTGALARCIEPTGDSEFLDEVFEQEPLYVPRAEPGRYDDLLSLEDLERMLCSGGLRHPAFRLVKAGERLELRDYATDIPWRPVPFTGTIDVPSALKAFASGATDRPPGAPPHASVAGHVLPAARS